MILGEGEASCLHYAIENGVLADAVKAVDAGGETFKQCQANFFEEIAAPQSQFSSACTPSDISKVHTRNS